jgi:hypothetical protein
MDYPDGTRRAEVANEQAQRDTRQAKLLLEARVAVFDTKKAELVAQKILAQHSTEMKVRLSELVVQTAEDLRSAEIRPKDRATAMVALKTVCDRLFGWDREPDIRGMKLARTSDQLAEMAKSEENRDDPKGASATGCNGLSMGPSAIAIEQLPAATHGCPIPEKEAPPSPVKEPAPSSRTVTRESVAQCLAPERPDPASSPAVGELEARREAFEQARAEHRRDNWRKHL